MHHICKHHRNTLRSQMDPDQQHTAHYDGIMQLTSTNTLPEVLTRHAAQLQVSVQAWNEPSLYHRIPQETYAERLSIVLRMQHMLESNTSLDSAQEAYACRTTLLQEMCPCIHTGT